jgi:hypothetical protein
MAQSGKVAFNINRPLRLRQGGGHESAIITTAISASVTSSQHLFYDVQDNAGLKITLPAQAGKDGWYFKIKNDSSGSGTIQVQDAEAFAAVGPVLASGAHLFAITNGSTWAWTDASGSV